MTSVASNPRDFSKQLRVDSIRATTAAGSGHPTSSLSAADLMAVLVHGHLRIDVHELGLTNNDHLVFSKGHASPLLYALLKGIGLVEDQDLMTLRKAGSRLEGHPTPRIPLVDAATGSLGQGLAVGVGLALSAKRIHRSPARTWVLLGDSEMAEGSNWEAFGLAAFYQLSNLVAIIDVNRLGQRGETMLGWDVDTYARRAGAFGWNILVIDGHDLDAIDQAYTRAASSSQPTCIVARTVKGSGVSFLANQDGWHGKALTEVEARKAIDEIAPLTRQIHVSLPMPVPPSPSTAQQSKATALPSYGLGEKIATRKAYGDTLTALGASVPSLLVLDGEVSNSTYAELFRKSFPDRYLEMYIAEQAMVSIGQGLAARGSCVFCSTFAAFWSRAHDQIRMASISQASLRLCGSHAGVSIGEDGPSQMAVEDLAQFRALAGSTVLYPCDASSTAKLVQAMAAQPGITYLRTTREKTPVVYANHEAFPIGGSKLLCESDHDRATIISAGITVHEALAAAHALSSEGLAVRVVDCYSVKPIDGETIRRCAEDTGVLIVVEDHRPEGGLGEAVLSALPLDGRTPLSFTHLAVTEVPRSGTPMENLEHHHLSRDHIAQAVREALAHSAVLRS